MDLLTEISLPDFCVDPCSCAMCFIMSFNVNNLPLAPQLKEISDSYNRDYNHEYNHKVWMD